MERNVLHISRGIQTLAGEITEYIPMLELVDK